MKFLRQICALGLVLSPCLRAADPEWWSEGEPPVIDPAGTESNFSPANIGQAKWMAWAAVNELERYLPAIAEQVRSDLSGIVDFSRPQTPEDFQTQLSPLNNGQLKAISAPFYNRLHAVAPNWLQSQTIENQTDQPGTHFPWGAAVGTDNHQAIATLGQLKAVFALRFGSNNRGDRKKGVR